MEELFEFDGQEYTLVEVQKAAEAKSLNIDDYIKEYNISRKPGKTTPTTPGAVVEETAAPDTDSKLEDGLLEYTKAEPLKEFEQKKSIITEEGSAELRQAGDGEFQPIELEEVVVTGKDKTKIAEARNRDIRIKSIAAATNVPETAVSISAGMAATTVDILGGFMNLIDKYGVAPVNYAIGKSLGYDTTLRAEVDASIGNFEVFEDVSNLFRQYTAKKYDNEGNEQDILSLIEQDNYADAAELAFNESFSAAPYLALSIASPIYGSALIGSSVTGQEVERALKERPDASLAEIYGASVLKGGVEFATNAIGGGLQRGILGIGKKLGTGTNAYKKAVDIYTKTYLGKIAESGIGLTKGGATNFIEEWSASMGSALVDAAVYNDPFEFKSANRQAINEGLVGLALGAPVGSLGAFNSVASKQQALEFLAPKQWNAELSKQNKRLEEAKFDLNNAPKNRKEKFQKRVQKIESLIKMKKQQLQNSFDNLTKKEKKQYADNLSKSAEALSQIGNSKYTIATQEIAKNDFNEANKQNEILVGKEIFDAEAEKSISKILKNSERIDEAFQKAKQKVKNVKFKYISDINAEFDARFDSDTNTITINKPIAIATEQTNAIGHELLHYMMAQKFATDNASMQPLVESFKNYLKETQPKIYQRVQERIDLNYTDEAGNIESGALEEYFNVFSDLVAKEKIIVNESFSDKIKNTTTRFLNSLGFSGVKLETGKDVFNFIRNYQKNISEFKFKQLGVDLKSSKISQNVKQEIQQSKESISGNNIQKIFDEKGKDGAFEIIEAYKPLTTKLTNKYRDVPGFDFELLQSEIEIGKRGLLDLINAYDPSKGATLNTYIQGQLANRSIEAANRILDTEFKLDVTEAKGVTDTVTVEEIIEEKEIEIKKAKKISFAEKIGINNDTKNKITSAVIKTFGTRLPSINSKEFKATLIKSYRTELKPIISKLMGTRENYESFLADNFKAIYNVLPQSTINTRFNEFAEPVLDKNGKQLREKTPEGKKIFVKKDITKAEWLNYFIGRNVGASTKGVRKTSIAEEIGVELAFDATIETISDENILNKFKEIQELQGNVLQENFIDVIERKIDRQTIKFSKTNKEKGILLQQKSLIINDLKTNGVNNKSIRNSFQNRLKGLLSDPEIEDLINEFIKELKPFKNIELKYIDDYFNKIINKEISSKAYTPGRILEYLNFKIKHLSALIKKFPQLKTDLKNGVFEPIREKSIEKFGKEKAAILWYSFMRQTIASRSSFLYKNKTEEFDAEFKEKWGEELYNIAVKNAINPSVKGRVISEIINDKGEPWFSRAKEAQEFLKFISEEGANIIKNDYSETHAIYFFDQLKSAEMGLIRLAALPKYAVIIDPSHKNLSFDELDNIYIYEHTMPAAYFRNALYDYYYNNNSKINIDALFDDYTVTLLPRNWDKIVNKAGFLDNMPASYSPGNVSVFTRYFNDFVIDIAKKENVQLHDIIDITTGEIAMAGNAVIKFSKSPNKKLRVFDFDDTLARSKSNVLYTMPDGTKGKLNAEQFAKQSDDLTEQGAIFDFSEFSKVIDGEKGPMFTVAKAIQEKRGNEDLFILTARPSDAKYAIKEFLDNLGLPFRLENIIGLGNGSPQAKANWIAEKLNTGYNDIYFTDDALKNVKAVAETLSAYDIKYRSQQVKFSKSLNKEFNKLLEQSSGVRATKQFSPIEARILGKGKGRNKFFIPYSADDFVGLLYTTLASGKTGDQQMEWYRENLLRPFSRGIQQYEAAKQNALREWQILKKEAKENVPGGLTKKNATGLSNQDAVRIYIWNQQGMEIPDTKGSQSLINENIKIVKKNKELKAFAEKLMALNPEGYPEPSKNWDSGDITTDLVSYINGVKRSEFLTEWKENADIIFSDKNKEKLRALYGDRYVEALDDILYRMRTGTNRKFGASRIEKQFMDWTNNSVGAIMFFNARSAVLQTLSAVNFINFTDNNPLNASLALMNQKQYWNDFSTLFNSDFLKQRRSGLQTDVNADEIARAAKGAENTARAALSAILKFGFTPTQIADSFAIASGGATFYRNRINKYKKEGLSKQEAKQKAFTDFQEIAEETQQSARPDRISSQQASSLGRLILAFGNTPMQYARLTKKAGLDLINGRGDWKTNMSKIMYYSVIQNIIFSALQQGLFALLFDDEDDDKEKSRLFRIGNSSLDTLLRGSGVYGAAAATVKNMILEIIDQQKSGRPDYTEVVISATAISPPINSKLRKLNSAGKTFTYKQSKEKVFTEGFSLENPAFLATGQIISAATNLPADRVVLKADHLKTAMEPETELWQAIALSLGWSEWDLNMIEKQTKKQSIKKPVKIQTGIKSTKIKTGIK